MSTPFPVTPTQLASGFCPATFQEMLNGFSAHQFVEIGDAAGAVIASATKPSDTSVIWLQLDQFGRPVRIYKFAQGAWLSLHTLAPGLTQWWFDTLPDFTTFDGGDSSALSSLSGPMWQQAKLPNGTAIAAQFPIVAGTLASGTVLAVGDVGGSESAVLTADSLPPHTHPPAEGEAFFAMFNSSYGVGVPDNLGNNGLTSENNQQKPGAYPATGENVPSTGDPAPVSILPPYAVGYLLQRTTRLFYAVT